MAYKTTATTDFNLDLNTIIEEAFERCGAELRTGYDFRTAKRSLALLLMDWSNRGINLWTLEEGTKTLTYNVGTYDLEPDTVDLLDHVIRTGSGTNQQDINISRISSSTYVYIPNKNATGRPIKIWINRRTGATGEDVVVVKHNLRFGRSLITAPLGFCTTPVCDVCLTPVTASMGRISRFGFCPAWLLGWLTCCR